MVSVVGPDGKETIKEVEVTKDEFQFNADYTMASGGMVLSGDDVSALNDDNTALLKRLLPPTNVACQFEDTSFTVGRAKMDEEKEIIYLFNFDSFKKEISVKINDKSEIFDLFDAKSLGTYEGTIKVQLNPHGAKVLISKNTCNYQNL